MSSTVRPVAAADRDLEAEIDRLYDTAPEDFVGEREAVARWLRGERRRDEAKQVHALRKPSQGAWAINRVARRKPELAEAVMSTGDALGEAQLALASGGGADTLRAAADAHQQAVNRFAQAAREALAQRGVASDEALRRVHETLFATATDPELAEQVRTGRVVKEQAPVGFGPLGAVPAPAPAPAERKRPKPAPVEDGARRRAELQARLRDARASEARAHEEAARLEAALAKADQRRGKAREKLENAGRKLAEAEGQAAELGVAAAQARDEAERASALLRAVEAEAVE